MTEVVPFELTPTPEVPAVVRAHEKPALTWREEARALAHLAWPIVLTQLAQMAVITTDVIMLGAYSKDALASAAIGLPLFYAVWMPGFGLAVAVSPMIAHILGARPNDRAGVRACARMGLWAAAIMTPPCLIALAFATPVLLALGDVKIPNVVTSFNTQSKGAFAGNDYSGNVGSGILKRFIVTFDYEHQIMYLKPSPMPLTDVGVFDRSGIWINDSQGGFKIVSVTPKGPAEEAGLKEGDVIVSIDGKLAGETTLPDLRQRLRNSTPGTKVKLGMQGGKYVTITLRDQI